MGLFSFVGWGRGKPAPVPQPGQKEAREVELLLQGFPVNISHERILAVQWEPSEQKMTIFFRNGSQYRYNPVSKAKILEFWAAPSKGTWLWDNILVRGKGKKGKHRVNVDRYRKV